jgi:diguanylate cyclase
MMDLDGFKRVNDTYGHIEGDKTLKVVAKCLLDCVRESDLLARWGGDEFVLLLPETSKADAQMIAEKLSTAVIECPYPWKKDQLPLLMLNISSGIVSYPEDGKKGDDLLKKADALLYDKKKRKV